MEASQKKSRTPRLVRGSQKPTMNTLHREGVCVCGGGVSSDKTPSKSHQLPISLIPTDSKPP